MKSKITKSALENCRTFVVQLSKTITLEKKGFCHFLRNLWSIFLLKLLLPIIQIIQLSISTITFYNNNYWCNENSLPCYLR